MENNITSEKTVSRLTSSGGDQEVVGSSRDHSGPLDSMVEEENITDVIVANDDVIISQNVLMNSGEISHSSEETLSINEECVPTKKECIELDVDSSLPVTSSSTFHTFSRKAKTPFLEDWKEAAQQPVLHVHCRDNSTRTVSVLGQKEKVYKLENYSLLRANSKPTAEDLPAKTGKEASGPVRLYQQCKRRRRPRNMEEVKVFKRCSSEPFPACGTPITLPVSELNQLRNPNSSVSSMADIAVDFSSFEAVSDLPLDKAWDKMNQALVNLEKGVCKTREMLEALRERTNREMEEQRRVLLQEKEDAIHQTKLEAHLSSVERPTESEFLVEVRSAGEQSVGEEGNASSNIQPVMLDSLATPIPSLCSSHIKKKCVNCNRETCSECSCRRKCYCSSFCQRRDWPSHRDECTALRSSPAREVPGYIFMLSD